MHLRFSNEKNEIDKQLYVQAIKEYFKERYDVRKLMKYAKIFGIEEKIRDYMEVLTWENLKWKHRNN